MYGAIENDGRLLPAYDSSCSGAHAVDMVSEDLPNPKSEGLRGALKWSMRFSVVSEPFLPRRHHANACPLLIRCYCPELFSQWHGSKA